MISDIYILLSLTELEQKINLKIIKTVVGLIFTVFNAFFLLIKINKYPCQ